MCVENEQTAAAAAAATSSQGTAPAPNRANNARVYQISEFDLPARFRRMPVSVDEAEAIETGGASYV
jgi:hypothetical protein